MPYGIVGVTLFLAAFGAFHRNGLIALGDLWPGYAIPGNQHLAYALSLWSISVSGLGSTSFNPEGILPAALCGLLAHIGFPPPLQQFTFYTALLIFEGIGTAYFVRGLFPERPVVALIAGLALPLSLYNATTFLNYIDAFAIGFFPLAAGWLVRRLRQPISPLRFAAECGLMSLGVMMIAGTPPIAAYFLAWAAGWIVAGWVVWRTFRQTAVGLALGVMFSLAINGWWAYQVIVTLGGGGAASQTFEGPIGWAWVDRRASLLNLLSMKAIWSLDYREYAPWFWMYERAPLRELVFAPLVFALASVLSPYRRRLAALFAVLAVSAFLAKGYHAPFGEANAFLYQHIPFFWLLRDPLVEAGITLYLALFTLAALGLVEVVSRIGGMLARAQIRARQTIERVAAFALLALLIASGVPFDVGATLSDEWLNGQARTVVDIPQYWYDAAAFLNRGAGSERVLIMPNDDFYAMPYDWGYYGADGPPRTLIHAAVVLLASDPYGYLAISPAARSMLGGILESIQSRPDAPMAPALRASGIGWILQRNDIKTTMPFRHILGAAYVASYLAHQPGIRKVISFGKLDVYRVQGAEAFISAYDGAGQWLSPDPPDLVRAGALLPGEAAWLDASDDTTGSPRALGFSIGSGEHRSAYSLDKLGKAWLTPRTFAVSARLVSPRTLNLHFEGPRVETSGAPLVWARDVVIALTAPARAEIAIRIGDDYYVAAQPISTDARMDLGVYTAPRDAPLKIEVYQLQPNVLEGEGWTLVADCRQPLTERMSQPSAAPLGQGVLRLVTGIGSSCASIASRGSLPRDDKLLAELEYKNVRGAEPAISFAAAGASIDDDDLLFGERWHRWQRVINAASGRPALAGYAFKTAADPTINEYRHAGVRRMRLIGEGSLIQSDLIAPVPAGRIRLEPGVDGPGLLRDPAFEHGLWGPIINQETRRPLPQAQSRESYSIEPGGVLELRARQGHLSERQTIFGASGLIVRVRLEARSLKGQEPVVRLAGSDGQTLWESGFHAGDSWQTVQADVHVGAGNDAVALELIGAADFVPSVVQFKNISLRVVPNRTGDVVAVAGKAPRIMPVHWIGDVDRYTARLPQGTRLFVLRNSFAEGWHVAAAGRDLAWRHVTVDGIFNGWIVPPHALRDIDVYFKPSVLFRQLQALAVAGITLCLVLLCLTALRPRVAGPAFR